MKARNSRFIKLTPFLISGGYNIDGSYRYAPGKIICYIGLTKIIFTSATTTTTLCLWDKVIRATHQISEDELESCVVEFGEHKHSVSTPSSRLRLSLFSCYVNYCTITDGWKKETQFWFVPVYSGRKKVHLIVKIHL